MVMVRRSSHYICLKEREGEGGEIGKKRWKVLKEGDKKKSALTLREGWDTLEKNRRERW